MSAGPPIARRGAHQVALHGEVRSDEYAWLREKTDPEVIEYLEAENHYTDVVMAPTRELQEALYQEMLARIQQTDLTVPYREGAFFYYTRTEEGKQYPIHCRKPGSLEAPEEIVLDLNRLAAGHSFMALGAATVSADGRLLAYSTDTTGFRVYDLHVRDLATGEDLPDRADDVGTAAWAADGRTLFYTTKDAAKREHRLHRLRLGDSEPVLVYEEPDERFSVRVYRSRSRAILFTAVESHTTTEVRFLPANDPDGAWTLITPRQQDREYYVDHHPGGLYVMVNDAGRNFRVVRAPLAAAGAERWSEVLAHRDDVMVEGMDCFRDHLVVQEREDGLVRLRILDLRQGTWHRVAFPEPVYAAGLEANREFATTTLRYAYQSFVTPPSVYDYEMNQRTTTLLKRTEVLGGYDPERYRSERLHATAPDGARVPISIVTRRDAPRPSALLLYAYGAYGMPLSATFSSARFSLVDRGVAYAIAHVRGGGELGKAWHDQGRMRAKPATFADFIAAAEHLIASGWTRRERLAIQGGSAGGLTVAAAVNARPELFRAVVAQVPFVDVLNTMSDPSLPLTVGEFEEWGNPADPGDYQTMRSYCPYTNLAPRSYPAMLVKTSLHDSQVMYWEPAKYVARLRTLKQDANPLLLKTNMTAGHGGASGRYDYLRELAFDVAFLLVQLGVETPAALARSKPDAT